MGVERVRVLIQHSTTGKIQLRRWSKPQLMGSVAWLKRMNARGNNILIQPEDPHALAFVGGLTKDAIDAMERNGFEPAVTVETRPGAFQAWIGLSTRSARETALLLASEGLARRFGGIADTNGYLAGFTVHRTMSAKDVAQFVRAREGQRQASSGSGYLDRVERDLRTHAERTTQRGNGRTR